jgi:hypothetical protein
VPVPIYVLHFYPHARASNRGPRAIPLKTLSKIWPIIYSFATKDRTLSA